jgi:FKBP-type peptidyl-prolyl cis-trans isomerase
MQPITKFMFYRNVDKEEEVVLPNGIRYVCFIIIAHNLTFEVLNYPRFSYNMLKFWIRYSEVIVGGGASPRPGDLVVIDLKGKVEGSGEVFVDTFGGEKKPLALVMGSRPYSRGVCEGIEYVLRSMKAGGKRKVIIPPSLGFGEKGAELGPGVQIPAFATLEYIVQVDKVSIAPA